MEARAALSRPGITNLPSNQIPVKMDMTSAPSSVVVPPPASLAGLSFSSSSLHCVFGSSTCFSFSMSLRTLPLAKDS